MIARTWKGATSAEDSDAYVAYQNETGLKEYRETPGNLGAFVLRRPAGENVEFVFVSLWDSLDAVRRFAGDDYDMAVFYPQDDTFLVQRDLHVHHYEVAAFTASSSTSWGDGVA